MKKKCNPVTLPHVEIICLAIKALDADIQGWRDKLPDTPAGFAMFTQATEEPRAKRELLLQMYQVETGTKYSD